MKLAKIIILGCMAFGFLYGITWGAPEDRLAAPGNGGLPKTKIARLESFIKRQMRLGKIPGMAVAVVRDDRVVYRRGFGFADTGRKQPVTPETMFELGSTSKAFTALGILYLAEKGLLSTHDPVKKYIPWFQMTMRKKMADPTMESLNRWFPCFYVTQNTDITIEQLLLHTSGIDPVTIADIPPSRSPDSLEKTVRTVMRKAMKPQMDYYPGERYQYATINYDILGLIISEVSGQSYEDFMKEHILEPLGMNHTVLFREQAGKNLATGYKVGFLRPLEYNAPLYRGNTPAGYIITNAEDMATWLKIQLDTASMAPLYRKIVALSHTGNYDYSNGWMIYRINHGSKILHPGSNPNYSSYIEFRPQEKLGVALLCNTNSGFGQGIGEGILNIINGRGRIPERLYDMFVNYDEISCLFIVALGIFLIFTVRFTVNRYRLNKNYMGIGGKYFTKFLIFGFLSTGLAGLFCAVPKIVFGYNWPFLIVWAPVSLTTALFFALLEIVMICLYLFNVFFFKGKDKKSR